MNIDVGLAMIILFLLGTHILSYTLGLTIGELKR